MDELAISPSPKIVMFVMKIMIKLKCKLAPGVILSQDNMDMAPQMLRIKMKTNVWGNALHIGSLIPYHNNQYRKNLFMSTVFFKKIIELIE